MKRWLPCFSRAFVLIVCAAVVQAQPCAHRTTNGAIAIANLDDQIGRSAGVARVDLLLARSRFLGDAAALSEAVRLAEDHEGTAEDWMIAAQAHAAEHQFARALDALAAAGRAGMNPARVDGLRASILVATGHAGKAIGMLETQAADHPGYATHSALAVAYAELGRYAQADALYARALADLDTTSPFPYAWLYFARGVMWAEQAGKPRRGARFYVQALACLPEFAAANIHMAEIEVARGQLTAAAQRLQGVLRISPDPEAMALFGAIQLQLGAPVPGDEWIERARARYTTLLQRHPLAFADHAAAFYLGPGKNAERAWQLASQNLANRQTARAFSLALDAARVANHLDAADQIRARARERFGEGFSADGRLEQPLASDHKRTQGSVQSGPPTSLQFCRAAFCWRVDVAPLLQ